MATTTMGKSNRRQRVDIVKYNDDDQTTTMRWQRVQLDNNDAMAMGHSNNPEIGEKYSVMDQASKLRRNTI